MLSVLSPHATRHVERAITRAERFFLHGMTRVDRVYFEWNHMCYCGQVFDERDFFYR